MPDGSRSDVKLRRSETGGATSEDLAEFLSHSYTVPTEVRDIEGGIAGIRDLLSNRSNEIRFAPYRPHLTLGLYSGAFDTRRIAAEITAFPNNRPLRWRIDHLHLVTYSAFELAGPLRRETTIALTDS